MKFFGIFRVYFLSLGGLCDFFLRNFWTVRDFSGFCSGLFLDFLRIFRDFLGFLKISRIFQNFLGFFGLIFRNEIFGIFRRKLSETFLDFSEIFGMFWDFADFLEYFGLFVFFGFSGFFFGIFWIFGIFVKFFGHLFRISEDFPDFWHFSGFLGILDVFSRFFFGISQNFFQTHMGFLRIFLDAYGISRTFWDFFQDFWLFLSKTKKNQKVVKNYLPMDINITII